MRVQMKCSCGWVFMVEAGSVGQTVQCPDCGRTLAAPVDGGVVFSQAAPVAQQAPPMVGQPVGQHPNASAVAMPTHVAGTKRPVGMAVASMICGILSLFTWCPCCFMMPLGVILGTIALMLGVISLAKKRGGGGMAVTGVITGAVGLLVSLGFLGVMIFASAGSKPKPPPGGWRASGTVATDGDSDTSQPPSVMTGDEMIEALTGSLELPASVGRARADLRMALKSYPRREQSSLALYECVQQFRRHLARAELNVPADAKHAEMFRTARDELIDIVLADYRKASEFERDGDWERAERTYGKMLEYLPDRANPVAKNVRSRRQWCRDRKRKAEEEDNMPAGESF